MEEQVRRFRVGGVGRFARRSPGVVEEPGDGRQLVLAVIGEHAPSLLATARRYSLCPDDAYDAYQRALEIFLRRAETLDHSSVLPWIRTVIKHEALAVRAARQPLVGHAEPDLDLHEDTELPTDEERIARFERATQAAEALPRLKPQERTALVLKAEGHSYAEIADRTGWTYTKVNRCIAEGRQRFLSRYAGIESGAECERWAPLLSAVADGEASAGELLELRPHLRRCAACRATVREHHGAARKIAAVLPLGVLPALATSAAVADRSGRSSTVLARVYDALTGGLHERATMSAAKLQSAAEVASSGKVAAIAASTAALAGGGLAVQEQLEPAHHARPPTRVHRVAVRHHRPPRRVRPAIQLVDAPAPRRAAPPSAPAPSPTLPPSPTPTPAPVASPAPAPSTAPSAPPSPPSRDFAPEQAASSSVRSAPRPAAAPRRAAPTSGSSGEFGP